MGGSVLMSPVGVARLAWVLNMSGPEFRQGELLCAADWMMANVYRTFCRW